MAISDNGTVISTQNPEETSKAERTASPTEPSKKTIASERTVSPSQTEEKNAKAERPADNHDGLTGRQLLRQVSSAQKEAVVEISQNLRGGDPGGVGKVPSRATYPSATSRFSPVLRKIFFRQTTAFVASW